MARAARRPTRSRNQRRRDPAPIAEPSPELAAELESYARQIDDASSWSCSPLLWYVAPTPDDGPDRGVLDLDGVCVPAALRGFRAQTRWHALGSWSTGSAFHTDDAATRRIGEAGRARITHVVHRSGLTVSLLRREDDDEPAVLRSAPGGRIDDYTRRALRMPTTPPTSSTLELFALQWLAAVIDEVPVSWPAAAALHPAAGGEPLDTGLDAVGHAFSIAASWAALREGCARGDLHIPGITRSLARWHDDGSFSRDLLGEWPPLVDLVDAALDVLPASAGARMVDVLDAWCLRGAAQ